MLKAKYWYVCLTAALVFGIPFSAVARLASNGTDLNTSQINSTINNGTLRVEGGQLVIQRSTVAQ